MNQDFVDLLRAFIGREVRFLVVGAYAIGAPLAGVGLEDFSRPGVVFQMGLAPRRIDVLTGLAFADVWPARLRAAFGPLDVDYIGRDAFIKNKKLTGRTKDLGDVQSLE